jgi:uroporphyrinogen decarboxylase
MAGNGLDADAGTTLSSRERIDRLLRRRRPDRFGLYENIWPDTLRRWAAEGYPVDEEGNPLDPVPFFGHDLGRVGAPFATTPRLGVHETLAETEEWVVRRDGAGAVLKTWKHKSGTPEHLDFAMASRAIWEREYRPHLDCRDEKRFDLPSLARRMGEHREAGRFLCFNMSFVWELLRGSLGDVRMLESFALDPGWIHDFSRTYTDFYQGCFSRVFDAVGKPDGVWFSEDLGYRNGLFCSPAMLREFILPYYKEMVGFLHARGIPVILHSCGAVEEALPVIVEAGFDALHPMERKAGCDPLRFAARYGDQLTFFGGIDARLFEAGEPAALARGITEIMDGFRKMGARYVFSSDHSLSTRTGYRTYLYALDVYRDHCGA